MFAHINASKTHSLLIFDASTLISITMAKKHTKDSRQKALKREAYRLNISVSELKRLKAASDSCNSPVPHHGDTFVSHESYEEVSQEDAPGGHEAAWQEATLGALGEAAAGEGAARAVPGGHDAASGGARAREAAVGEGAARAVPGGHDAASGSKRGVGLCRRDSR